MDDGIENRECFAAGQPTGGEERLPTGVVKVICISDVRGIEKRVTERGHLLVDSGIKGDTHGDSWHRQASLLSYDKVKASNERGANVGDDVFEENLVVEGLGFRLLPVGAGLYARSAELVMIQIDKEYHSRYVIYKRMGECIIPKEGVFAKVVKGGVIRPGDMIRMRLLAQDHPLTVAIMTFNDKGARGERKNESGPTAKEMLEQAGYEVIEAPLIPDEPALLKTQLIRLSDGRQLDLILTSGGTGFSLGGQTLEAALMVADRNAPGIVEVIRSKSLQITDRAMLSEGVSVIRGRTLIVNLPGNPKAVRESLGFIMGSLEHGIKILRGSASEYARKQPGESWRENRSRIDRCKDMT